MAKQATSGFAKLKANRTNSLEQVQKKLEEENKKSSYQDDRFWQAQLDKSGNAFAIIRFLPAVDGESVPWVKRYSHSIQANGWYIENCPTTIEKECPACKENTILWNSGIDANKDIVRKRKRKLSYISNILVLHDKKNPENEGKVFLFRYGAKIFEKMQSKMAPEYEGEVGFNPFDFWEGADFKLKIKKVSGYSNYDDSGFEPQTPLLDGDEAVLEKIWKSEYPLLPFIDPSEFKSFDDLKKRLDIVLGGTPNVKARTVENVVDKIDDEETRDGTEPVESESMDYFASLANED